MIVTSVPDKPPLKEVIEHYGVKGMHWGVHKSESTRTPLVGLGPDRIERTTAKGDKLVLTKQTPTKIHNALGRISKNYTKNYNDGAFLTISDKSGKRVGSAIVQKKSDTELYLNWLGIDKGSRGQGYATEAMKTAAEYGKKQGFKKLTLEVPGNSPDARHIYEKLGFKIIEENINPNEPIWGGLTTMEYNIK